MRTFLRFVVTLGAMAVLATAAVAQQPKIKVGIIISTTGPAATLGIPEKNVIALFPKTIGGAEIDYIVLDDASEPTNARRLAERLVFEDKVDLLMGPTISPPSLAVIEVAGRSKTPMIAFAAARSIIAPMDEIRRWVYKTTINEDFFARATTEHMKKRGYKNVAVLGFNDAFGEGWSQAFEAAAKAAGLNLVVSEKYNKNDTSVTAQALKVVSAKPDAVLIIAAGTPGVLPQITLLERGFKGQIYQTTGVTTNDFLRVGGKNVEGTIIATGALIVADQIPDAHPAKRVGVELTRLYTKAYGENSMSAFPGFAYDGFLMAQAAIPTALQKARPGTPEFRQALNDALSNAKNVATTIGLVNMTPDDHTGFSAKDLVMMQIKGNKWTYIPD